MENACLALRSFLLNEVNAHLKEREGDGVRLPQIGEPSCAIGVIDPLRLRGTRSAPSCRWSFPRRTDT